MVAAAMLGLAVGCVPLPEVPNALPPPPQTARYLLQAGDQLDIKFLYNPELNEQITLQPDGRFSIGFARDVLGAGSTVEEVAQMVSAAYAKELREPAITVQLRSALPTRVYVAGEVNTPGEYVNVGPNLTFVQAIARAGGLKNSANYEQIVLIRRTGQNQASVYGLNFVRATGGIVEEDVQLAAYDTIFVPRSGVANVYLAYQQYFQQFLPSSFSLSLQRTP